MDNKRRIGFYGCRKLSDDSDCEKQVFPIYFGESDMIANTYGELGNRSGVSTDLGQLRDGKIDWKDFNGLSTLEDLLEVYNLPLKELAGLAVQVRAHRLDQGETSDCCSSGFLPHQEGEGAGCEMSCSFCGFPEKIFEENTGNFVAELSVDAIIKDAVAKKKRGATRYKIVALGCTIRDDEYEVCMEVLPKLFDEHGFEHVCLSFGALSESRIVDLIDRFGTEKIQINHNVEVGNRDTYEQLVGNTKFFWESRYKTVLAARKLGLDSCTGGLVGIGESTEDQADLVLTLRSLNVTSSPFNVFVLSESDRSAIATKIRSGEMKRPTSEELLRTICMWRLGLPKSSIASNSGFGITGDGDFGIYSGLIELALINDKVSLANQGKISTRNYHPGEKSQEKAGVEMVTY